MTWFRRDAHPEEQLSAYVDGELDQAGRRSVEAHLASCEACTELVRDLQAAKAVVSELPRLEPRRSFTLGPEYARPPKPAMQRSPFAFAPAAALTLLVALLVVDVADFGGSGIGGEGGLTAANSQRTEPAGGAIESLQRAEDSSAAAGAAESAADDAGQPTPAAEDAPAAFSAPSADDSSGGVAADSEDPARPVQDGASEEPAAAPAPQEETSKTGQPAGPEDSSGGVPLLRILQVLAGAAFVASSLVVLWPRLVGRGVR